jgi:integrase
MHAWQVNPRYPAASMTQALARASRKDGATQAPFHDFRHTFVINTRRLRLDEFRIVVITGP